MISDEGELKLDFDDEVIAGACITRDGEIVHEGAKAAAARPRLGGGSQMDSLVIDIAMLVLAGFVGFAVISKVPNTLHTPLMSGTNAIHGIVVLGGLLLMSESSGVLEQVLLVIAVAFGTINVVGGFLVTDRMLEMFKSKDREPPKPADDATSDRRTGGRRRDRPGDGLPADDELHRRGVHRRVLAVDLRDERADRAADGGARQQDRGRRAWRSRWSRRCCARASSTARRPSG